MDVIAEGHGPAFLILLCERMMPSLRCFAEQTDFDCSVYQNCLDIAWKNLAGDKAGYDYDELAKASLNATPDTEKFDHPLRSAALSTALSVRAVMRFLAAHGTDHLQEAASLAVDTAALYAQSIKAVAPFSLTFDEVMAQPVVKQEQEQQAEDVRFLNFLPTDIPREMIPLIQERARRALPLLPPGN